MKKFLKIILIYALGIICVFTLVWRADNINSINNELASNYENNNFITNN